MIKKKRLTKIVSYLYKHKFLDESCFEDGELTEDDYLNGGEAEMAKAEKKDNDIVMSIFANAVIIGGCVVAFTITCGVAYYSIKGTVELFKTIGGVGAKIIKR